VGIYSWFCTNQSGFWRSLFCHPLL